MTIQTQTSDVSTFRETALGFSDKRVATMVKNIEASFERRDDFESAKGVSTIGRGSSYAVGKDAILKASGAVARMFLALNIEPKNVFERSLQSNDMFNAKALVKLAEIASWACGNKSRLQKVTKAFLACLIVMNDRGVAIVTNTVNRKFLNSADFGTVIADQETVDQLNKERHTVMTGGAPTQSSQVRCVLEALDVATIHSADKHRDAIALDAKHSFVTLFRTDFMK